MVDPTSPSEGDVLRVTIAEQDGDVLVLTDREYDLKLLDSPHLEEGTCEDITVTVTNTWYSTSGELDVVFVSPSDETAEATISARHRSEKDAKGSSGSQSDNRPSSVSASSGQSANSRSSRQRRASKGDDGSLHDIADDLIGDEEFEVTSDEESSISAAKEKAKKQGRDPAIDPKLSDSK